MATFAFPDTSFKATAQASYLRFHVWTLFWHILNYCMIPLWCLSWALFIHDVCHESDFMNCGQLRSKSAKLACVSPFWESPSSQLVMELLSWCHFLLSCDKYNMTPREVITHALLCLWRILIMMRAHVAQAPTLQASDWKRWERWNPVIVLW